MKISKWYHIYICVKCEKRISEHNYFYNRAVCPNCGYSKGGTICDAHKLVIRKITTGSWWLNNK